MTRIFQLGFFWVVMPCSVMVGYQHFGGPCSLYLHSVTIQKISSLKYHRREKVSKLHRERIYCCRHWSHTNDSTLKSSTT